MKSISRFALEKHDGPYETWPLRSRLTLDGKPTDISLPDYTLLHQFETSNGYILVTDYDCPYEEITNFALISKQLRLQSCRWFGWMYENILARAHRVDRRSDFHGLLFWQPLLPVHGSLLGDPVHTAPSEAPVG
jgi:hypothetical protein